MASEAGLRRIHHQQDILRPPARPGRARQGKRRHEGHGRQAGDRQSAGNGIVHGAGFTEVGGACGGDDTFRNWREINVSGTLRVPLAGGTRSVPDTLGSGKLFVTIPLVAAGRPFLR